MYILEKSLQENDSIGFCLPKEFTPWFTLIATEYPS